MVESGFAADLVDPIAMPSVTLEIRQVGHLQVSGGRGVQWKGVSFVVSQTWVRILGLAIH